MAKKASQEGVSKSDLTRRYVAKNPSASPNEIVKGLRAEGVGISVALASKIKYARPGKTAKRRGRPAKKPVASRKTAAAGGVERGHKAEAIRSAARSLGKKVRPRDVIAMLKDQGIEVSSAQVSTTLKSMGMRRSRRGGKTRAAMAAAPRMTSKATAISIDYLIAAKKLVNQLGSVEAASQALAALAKLS